MIKCEWTVAKIDPTLLLSIFSCHFGTIHQWISSSIVCFLYQPMFYSMSFILPVMKLLCI